MGLIQNYTDVSYRPLRAQASRPQFPGWFNHLIGQGFLSPGLTEAALTDKSIFRRVQRFFSIINTAPATLGQHQPLVINPANEKAALAALDRKGQQTELSLIYLERNCQYVFLTKGEEQALTAPAPAPNLSGPVRLGDVPTTVTYPCFTAPPKMGGIIVSGRIEKTVSQDRITLWKRRGHWQLFRLPRRFGIDTGERLSLDISNGHVTVVSPTGLQLGEVDLVDERGNPENGLRIERFGPYLPWAGQIVGQYYKQFSSIGELKIGWQTIRYPGLANEIARINFVLGLASLFHLTATGQENYLTSFQLQTRAAIARNVLKQDLAPTFTGPLTRTVGEKGLFSLGFRDMYIDTVAAPSGTRIQLTMDNGEITEIWHEQGYPIPLTALRLTSFYDATSRNPSLMTGIGQRLARSFEKKSGYWQVPNEETGSTLYFAQEKHLLRPGYAARFVQLLDGKVVGLRYYLDPKASPDSIPDKEDIYKRFYVNDKLTVTKRSKFEPAHWVAVKTTDTVKITHWQIPASGCLELKGKKIHLQGLKPFVGKYIILTLSRAGNALNIYDQPETDPNKTPLRSIRL